MKKPPYGMIAILFIGAFVAFLNNTLLNVALPTIMIEFDVTPSQVQWLTTGYMLVNGILIPASAYFIQKFKNKTLFITAMSLFSLGTLIAWIAPGFWILVASRMIQACGSAIMMPLLMNVMLIAFPIERRGTAMGIFGLVMIMAPAIGPTLSGFIVENYSWRVLFAVILPFALIPLVLAIFKLKNITPQREVTLDKFSLVLSSVGFGGLLYGFSVAGDEGWTSWIVVATLGLGTIGLVWFILRQLRLPEPLLEFRIYKYPMFALASAISIVLSAAMFSGMILTPLYVQTIRGFSPLDSGLLMLPGALVMAVMSPITGRLFDAFGAKWLAISGLSISAITTFALSGLTLDTSYASIMFLYTMRMFGFSMIMMPVMTNGLNQLDAVLYPHGTAMNNTLQQVSGAIGSAIFLTIMNARMSKWISNEIAIQRQSGEFPVDEGAQQAVMEELTRVGMLEGITFSFFIAAIVTIVALVLSFFIKRVVPKREAI
ncbi:EmrB/QacA subfamily drug resistance transporter [Chryseomicrobium aureum]|uniref:DHA2 family efflux MFS transporter permease subunit n=1 Tax=Chryseomicrobium aureum TaxID=1441723 RepID=UPI00195A01C9|nr:DHA2 family efflux MFS transporter permease subunit [Chryseomicrobium aureum]MBM7705585.1 EmrB/QacA subfamily drug resistance transporter [Chryseomicrobium aureum]